MKKFTLLIISFISVFVLCLFSGCSLFNNNTDEGKIKVTCYANGGTFEGGEEWIDIEVPVGKKLKLPTPERPDYVLTGWYNTTEREMLNLSTYVAKKDESGKPVDITLHARWELNSEVRLIEFDGIAVKNAMYPVVKVVDEGALTYSFENKAVCGKNSIWKVKRYGTELSDYTVELDPGDNFFNLIVSSPEGVLQLNYTINIHRPHQVTVYYLHNGTELYSTTCLSGQEYPVISTEGFDIPGYDVDYWTLDNEKIQTFVPLNDTYIIAKTKPKTYTVTVDWGGFKDNETVDVAYDSGFWLPTQTSWLGHEFLGWYYNDSYIGKAGDRFTLDYPGDITIYAKWRTYTYSISVDSNNSVKGGEVVGGRANFSAEYGEEVTIEAKIYPGYTFIGWYSTEYGTVAVSYQPKYTFKVTQNAAFYARWKYCVISGSANISGVILPETSAYGEECTIRTTFLTMNGLTFDGWFYSDRVSARLSTEPSYTFVLQPNSTPKLEARWKGSAVDDFEFETDDGQNFTIVGLKNSSLVDVVIPSYVTAINNISELSNNYNFVRLTIEAGCKLQGLNGNFTGCKKIIEVRNIAGISIGNAGAYAKHIVTNDSTNVYFDDDGFSYYDDGTETYLLGCERTTTGYLFLPYNFNGKPYKIYDYAFYGRDALRTVTIRPLTKGIGKSAFANCSNMNEIYFGATEMEDLESDALPFSNNTKQSITLTVDSDVTRIPAYLCYDFNSMTGDLAAKIKKVVFSSGSKCTYIGEYAFNNSNITDIYIPASVTHIGASAINCFGLVTLDYNAEDCTVEQGVFVAFSSVDGFTLKIGRTVRAVPDNFLSASDSTKKPKVKAIEIASDGVLARIGENALRGALVTTLTLPATVTEICTGAFKDCVNLTKLYFNAKNCTVEEGAFEGSSSGVTAYIGSTVEKILGNFGFPQLNSVVFNSSKCSVIGDRAFVNSSLTEIELPNSVTEIGAEAFRGCTSLKMATIPSAVTVIGEYAFADCGSITINYNAANIKECAPTFTANSSVRLNIGSTVRTLIPNSFGSGITQLVFNENINNLTVQGGAFRCEDLISINLGGKYITLEKGAFYLGASCTSITYGAVNGADTEGDVFLCSPANAGIDITIDWLVKHVPAKLFYSNGTLTGSQIKASSITIAYNRSDTFDIGGYAFANLGTMDSFTLGPAISNIAPKAFSGTQFKKVVYNSNVDVDFEDYVFENCEIELGALVKRLPSKLAKTDKTDKESYLKIDFYNASNLECIGANAISGYYTSRFNSSSKLKTLEDYALSNVWIREELGKMPATIEVIGNHAFDGAYIENISLNNVKSLGEYAFKDCTALASCTLSGSYTEIPTGCFSGCSALKSFTIPNTVVKIGAKAFEKCTSLTSVTFPDSSSWKVDIYRVNYPFITDTKTAAEYLTDRYVDYDWVRI